MPTTVFEALEESASKPINHRDEHLCRVCERSYDGSQHLGIEVCRACATFFRRSIEARKMFVCRKGANRCKLNAPRKVMCQKCRLTRCLTVGLQPELVQRKRSIIRERLPNCLLEFKVDKEEPSTSSDLISPPGQTEFQNDITIYRPIPTVNPVHSPGSPYLKSNLLYKVLHNYRKMYEDRWAMELTVPGGEGAPTYNASGKIISLVTLTRLSDIMRRQMDYITKFIRETFEEFASFDDREQQFIINVFMSRFWELEGSYWTYRNLPAQQMEKMMLSLTTYSDLSNLEYLMDGTGVDELQDTNQLKEVITSLQMHVRATIIDQMHGIILSEVEFVALLSLSFWAPRVHRGSEKAERIANKYRAQIFYGLHKHYRDERRVDNYANRLGDIMCLFADVQMNATRIGEDVELLKLFNMYRLDSTIYEYLNGHWKRF
ncbi:Nuclear receptor domain-containing protein [Trichostrongylus colubriformis]|uniref:Nuclear receptor domain-containing protein n=1 Tax=Trichostrongylus colubriformis TaxID=6319 RepID=A0AAN8F257_TRICO